MVEPVEAPAANGGLLQLFSGSTSAWASRSERAKRGRMTKRHARGDRNAERPADLEGGVRFDTDIGMPSIAHRDGSKRELRHLIATIDVGVPVVFLLGTRVARRRGGKSGGMSSKVSAVFCPRFDGRGHCGSLIVRLRVNRCDRCATGKGYSGYGAPLTCGLSPSWRQRGSPKVGPFARVRLPEPARSIAGVSCHRGFELAIAGWRPAEHCRLRSAGRYRNSRPQPTSLNQNEYSGGRLRSIHQSMPRVYTDHATPGAHAHQWTDAHELEAV